MASKVSPARGMRDILPREKAHRDRVLASLRATFTRHGFHEIETPAVEPLSRLKSDQGGENESMLFEILRRGLDAEQPLMPADATDQGLRYDLTVPLSRFYASHRAELPAVFRSYQTGPVWRAERPQKGRYRQFTQCDIDVIGEPGPVAEADVLSAVLAAFDDLGMLADVRVIVNDRRTLTALLDAVGVPAAGHGSAMITLDKLHKIGADGVIAELESRGTCDAAAATRLVGAVTDADARAAVALDDGQFVVPGVDDPLPLHDLPVIARAVRAVVPSAEIVFDPTLVRGMGYYTGAIFEVEHRLGSSSVAGGGRYDGVIGRWLGQDVPACGFSVGFERMVDLVTLPDDGGHRIALVHRPAADPGEVLARRAELQAGDPGVSVALVPAPRSMSAAFFASLVEQGYTHLSTPTDDGYSDVRELGPRAQK